jgi:hypothetical protein
MKGKEITILMSMPALMMFSAGPTFAQTIEVEEGDVTITDPLTSKDSTVQSGPASVVFGDDNEYVQVVNDFQNAFIDIAGDENEVFIDQPLS